MNKNSLLANLMFMIIAGMGNVKHGRWQGILTYFLAIIILGIGLIYAELRFIEPHYHPSQTVRTFLILIYIAFAFFWNGTSLLDSEVKKRILTRNGSPLSEKDSKE